MARLGERQPLSKTVLLGKETRPSHTTWTVSRLVAKLLNGENRAARMKGNNLGHHLSPRNLHFLEVRSLHGHLCSLAHYAIINSAASVLSLQSTLPSQKLALIGSRFPPKIRVFLSELLLLYNFTN